jgi:triphosphoribosyl-dephospho-CoA synthase
MSTRFDDIAAALQLALLLEVSAYPKPGNIHRTQDFENTCFEHFLASSAALGSHFRVAARHGYSAAASGSIGGKACAIGKQIRRAVESCSKWQHGGNTSLGTIMLLIPIACAAGMIHLQSPLKPAEIRKNLRRVVHGTTSTDAVDVYQAISCASPGGLGEKLELDVNDRKSIERIRKQKLTPLDVFRISSRYDTISSEWVDNYSVTFDIGLPYLARELQANGDINAAVVDTYLRLLSQFPDTLIARKLGMKKAREISLQARRVLRAGGMKTAAGRLAIRRMDRRLQSPGHECNPGTTADLTASALSVLLLSGYRP